MTVHEEQPMPIPNDRPSIQGLVRNSVLERVIENIEVQHVTFIGPDGQEIHPDWCRECRLDQLRAQLACAVVFPEDWRKRLTDLPHVGTVTLARLADEIESWPRPRELTTQECLEIAARLLDQAERAEKPEQEKENA